MKIDRKALNLFKTYMVLGPDYQRERLIKPMLPKSITHLIMQYAQYEDWMKTAKDLAALLKRYQGSLITNSESWAQDESLGEAKKWLANSHRPCITESYDFHEKTIMPLLHFLAKIRLTRGRTVLMFAAKKCHTEVLKALLAVPGIDVNAVNETGLTALMIAASNGHIKALQVLLAAPGIDVNVANKDGWTALISAASRGEMDTLNVLLAVPGIDVNAQTHHRMTALNFAERYGITESTKHIFEKLAQHDPSNHNKRFLL